MVNFFVNTVNNFKNKKAVIFFGSPNNHGNTAKLLDQFLHFCPENIEATLLCAYDLKINPCIGCDRCKQTGACFYGASDDFKQIEKAIRESDYIVIATPIYFLGFPAPLKQIFDRFQSYFYRKPLHEFPLKRAVLLTTSGSKDCTGPEQIETASKYILDTIHAELVKRISVKNTDRCFLVSSQICQEAAEILFQK